MHIFVDVLQKYSTLLADGVKLTSHLTQGTTKATHDSECIVAKGSLDVLLGS